MALEHLNPEGMHRPTGYTHVVRTSGRLAFISGQVAVDVEGNVVGVGDFEAQARQVFANLKTAVEAAGASMASIAKLNTYIVNYSPELRPALAAARQGALPEPPPASTLIGVQALARPELLIEVEAVVAPD